MLYVAYFFTTVLRSRTLWLLLIGLIAGVAAERSGLTSGVGPATDPGPKVVRLKPAS